MVGSAVFVQLRYSEFKKGFFGRGTYTQKPGQYQAHVDVGKVKGVQGVHGILTDNQTYIILKIKRKNTAGGFSYDFVDTDRDKFVSQGNQQQGNQQQAIEEINIGVGLLTNNIYFLMINNEQQKQKLRDKINSRTPKVYNYLSNTPVANVNLPYGLVPSRTPPVNYHPQVYSGRQQVANQPIPHVSDVWAIAKTTNGASKRVYMNIRMQSNGIHMEVQLFPLNPSNEAEISATADIPSTPENHTTLLNWVNSDTPRMTIADNSTLHIIVNDSSNYLPPLSNVGGDDVIEILIQFDETNKEMICRRINAIRMNEQERETKIRDLQSELEDLVSLRNAS